MNILHNEPRTKITPSRLFLKAAGATDRKLVFNHETGELLLLEQTNVHECLGDIVIDQIFDAEDHF